MYHVNLVSSEDIPTHYLRKLPVTNDQKSHDQSFPFYPRILQHNARPHRLYEWSGDETNVHVEPTSTRKCITV